MHLQTAEREERLSGALGVDKATEAVAVVSGAGNRRLFEELGAGQLVDGGRTMNPSAQQLLDAIERAAAPEAILLPNNPNVLMSAEQAARHASKPVRVIPTRSLQEGLAALVAFDSSRSAEANLLEMFAALESVATGAVTVSSRDAEPERHLGAQGRVARPRRRRGDRRRRRTFEEVARAVLERAAGRAARAGDACSPARTRRRSTGCVAGSSREHPEVELDVQEGGQPHYPLLLSAE